MTQSLHNPENIQVDWGTFQKGKVTILVHWNVTSSIDEEGNPVYNYDEVRMPWILPEPFESREAIQTYFNNNYDQGENILNWAKAVKVVI